MSIDNVVQFKPADGSIVINKNPKTKERKIENVHIDAHCPKCDTIMVAKPFEEAMALWRGQMGVEFYPHECSNPDCGHVENYSIRYPTLGYRFVE